MAATPPPREKASGRPCYPSLAAISTDKSSNQGRKPSNEDMFVCSQQPKQARSPFPVCPRPRQDSHSASLQNVSLFALVVPLCDLNIREVQLKPKIDVRSLEAHTSKQMQEPHTLRVNDQHHFNLSPRRSTYPFSGKNIECQNYGNTSPNRSQSGNGMILQTEPEDVEDDDIEDPAYMSNRPPASPTSSGISEYEHEELFDLSL